MDSRLEEDLYGYLVQLGYPESSIVYQPTLLPIKTGVRYRPDFALIDPATKDVLAIIEVKAGPGLAHLDQVAQQLRQYVAALGQSSTQGFVATPSQSSVGFDFYTLDDRGHLKQLPSGSFLQFGSLLSGRGAVNKEARARVVDRFAIVCFALAAVSFTIVVADFICAQYGVILLTTNRMIMLGAGSVLVIVPYFQKFRALGIEFERYTKRK